MSGSSGSVLLGVAPLRILLVLQLMVHDHLFVLWLILLVLALQKISLVLLLRTKLEMELRILALNFLPLLRFSRAGFRKIWLPANLVLAYLPADEGILFREAS